MSTKSARLLRFGPYVTRTSARLGSGHFGTVVSGVHEKTGRAVAIKLEQERASSSGTDRALSRLTREAEVYRELDGSPAFPRLHWFGRANGSFALVLDRLGPSLREVHRALGLTLSARAVQHVGNEAVLRLEVLHDAGWLHCDVKPANLLLPRGVADRGADTELASALDERPQLFLVDYGLSRRCNEDVPSRVGPDGHPRRRSVVGTGRFASLANHEGETPLGRRDDLEATLLSLVYLHLGKLPWSGLAAPTKRERFALMLSRKQATSVQELADGMPRGFGDALHLVRALAHDERPDYAALRRLLGAEDGN